LGFDFIAEHGKGGFWARIIDDALPFDVAVQLRQNGGQILHQLGPFLWWQRPDGGFNFRNRAHIGNITESD